MGRAGASGLTVGDEFFDEVLHCDNSHDFLSNRQLLAASHKRWELDLWLLGLCPTPNPSLSLNLASLKARAANLTHCLSPQPLLLHRQRLHPRLAAFPLLSPSPSCSSRMCGRSSRSCAHRLNSKRNDAKSIPQSLPSPCHATA